MSSTSLTWYLLYHHAGEMAFFGGLAILAYSVVGLVAIWVAWGRPHWFLRLAVLGGLLSLGLAVRPYDLMIVFLLHSLLVIVPLWTIRRRASFVRPTDREVVKGTNRSPRTGWQFSLSDLFLATVVVAAMAAFLASVPADDWKRLGYGDLLEALSAAVSTLLAAWMGLGKRFLWLRLVLLLLLNTSALAAAGLMLGRVPLVPLQLIPLLLVPSSIVMTCWTVLMRASGYDWLGTRETEPCPAGTTEPVRRRALRTRLAKLATLLLSLGILIPLGAVYYLLVIPVPIPETTLPAENGYGTLAEAAEVFDRVGVPDPHTATEKQLRTFVTQHRQVLDKARDALKLPCQVPLEYSKSDMSTSIVRIHLLGYAFLAEGKLAEMEGRTADAMETYLTLIELGHAAGRGGLYVDAVGGWGLELMGTEAMCGLRDNLTAEQSDRLIDVLESLDARRELGEDILPRERAWECNVFGWFGRLYQIKSDLFSSHADVMRDGGKSCQAQARLLICELGIRTYQSEHGSPPQRLADLVPDYLPAVPQDPFGQGPLVFRRTSTDYVLYSVGYDGRDDEAHPRTQSPSGEILGDLFLEEPPDDPGDEL